MLSTTVEANMSKKDCEAPAMGAGPFLLAKMATTGG
jgi:hypothetical protein